MSKKIVVYSMLNCPFCVKAKNLLTQRGLPFDIEMVDDWSDDRWNDLVKKSKMKTLPQIYAGETLIGGYSQLEELDQKDHLISLK